MSVEEPGAVPLICWEAVATNLYRVSVPGGWLYSCPGGEHGPDTVAFVSDPESTPPLAVHDALESRVDRLIERADKADAALVGQLTLLVTHENRLHALETTRALLGAPVITAAQLEAARLDSERRTDERARRHLEALRAAEAEDQGKRDRQQAERAAKIEADRDAFEARIEARSDARVDRQTREIVAALAGRTGGGTFPPRTCRSCMGYQGGEGCTTCHGTGIANGTTEEAK